MGIASHRSADIVETSIVTVGGSNGFLVDDRLMSVHVSLAYFKGLIWLVLL